MKNFDISGIRTSDLPICYAVHCSSTVTPYLGILLKLNFMETRPVAAQLFLADTKTDERTDRHNDAFKHNK